MQALAQFITRPQRQKYKDEVLRNQRFDINGKSFVREPLELEGKRGKIVASWYYEQGGNEDKCIVYCHGNSGCQADCEEVLDLALWLGFCVCGFDFSGCGKSEGDFVSLGIFEKDDIETVVDYLYLRRKELKIILWGRSMGAVSSILYVYSNPHIIGLILDSPFSDFCSIADSLVASYKIIPKSIRSLLFNSTFEYIQTHYKFNIRDLKPINFIQNCKIPAIFIHSIEDSFINISNSRELYSQIKGPKSLLEITGDHGSYRSRQVLLKTFRVLDILLKASVRQRKAKETARNNLPRFKPKIAELVRHRRGFSQNINV